MTESVKKMTLKDFVELGFLQELNRQFLHPRGLALAVTKTDDNKYFFDGIYDAREDPEGWAFEELDKEKATKNAQVVEQEYQKRLKIRNRLYKTRKGIQPIEDAIKSSTD